VRNLLFCPPAKKQIPRFARNDKGESNEASAGASVFRSFVHAGERLADIHVHYENAERISAHENRKMIDQYQVSTDKRRGITNDPNRADDPQYIVRLIGQSITVGRLEDRADAAGMRISET
jgi:predicted helicase